MKTTVQIQNLKCGGCGTTILKRLSNQKGIQDIAIDVDKSTVSFNYENIEALKDVEKTLTNLGYPVVGEENGLGRKARSYLSCAVGRMTG